MEAFCEAWSGPDWERIEALLAAEILYLNGPLPPLRGHAAVMNYLQSAGPFDAVRWDILHIARRGDTVLTERVDRMWMDGRTVALPIMGAFRLENGLIAEWRDYFDLASYRAQQTAVD
ncbi:limonene-1,2-epoxide hydrolase family protein [Novosphingobium sp. PC22D]|uniref:limonene-1,2-epoxide hydrolase family protein n=1 Tax=Novosphingobium sp. PC22D TaxID=1962403 RepID=UPI001F0A4023|nr:limonene-1,2-epoxide hydrolase family protein [Novosphingobium sp. PC22D]